MKALQEAKEARNKKQNKIEKIKELKTPLSLYQQLENICQGGLENLANEDSSYFLKCFGLFQKKDGRFMLRIRIPAGQLTPTQAIKLGELSTQYGEDHIDITTRQQLEFRFLALQDLHTILQELDSVGISTFQTGIDNFRNIVTSSFDGLGKSAILKTKPLIDELQAIFMHKEEWIGTLPRKFNTAILGNSINDCNIYGHDCCFVTAKSGDELGFNLYLGGRVGVQARDTGLFIKESQVVPTFNAVINLFKEYGFRDNRNKNRLHFLLEAVGMEAFVSAIKEYSGLEYLLSGEILATDEYRLDSSGIFDLDERNKAVHLSIPSGVFKGSDLKAVGELAQSVKGEIRLSVEQSLYIITSSAQIENVKSSPLFNAYATYQNIYFNHQIACAGTATCAFGVIPNKPDAINLANFLAKEVPIEDGKVRMYWSACPKGCGIHGIADIGFEGCKAKDSEGNKIDGVHIYLGGKATRKAKEARVLAKSVPLSEAKYIIKNLMEFYCDNKEVGESFESFEDRVLSSLNSEDILKRVNCL
ncbi:MAG: ferredoxin--nitrite reductase [Campylobacterota bacterium]|nr:ferredoxin--nitrite reductase [Campylobacterota bacterium]